MILDKLEAQLRIDEGERNTLYRDPVGKWTGGVGRNFTDRPMSPALIKFMLDEDVVFVCADLDRNVAWWRGLCDARQNVLANMCFNMGWPKLAGFKRFLAALQAKQYDKAADEMMDSAWAKQVGDRAKRLENLMRLGYFP